MTRDRVENARRRTADRLVVETLAETEDDLCVSVVDLMAERDAYRELAQVAFHELHKQHVELTRLREQHARLRDELRALRPKVAA